MILRMDRDRAKSVLHKMPAEVFDSYIVPLVEYFGWPYVSDTACVSQGWVEAFDNQPLSVIADLDGSIPCLF